MMFCRWSTLISSWMEQAPSIHLSCAQPSLGRHGVQILAEINFAFHVALERRVVDSTNSFNIEIWLEQHFHVKETFSVDSDGVSVCENVLDFIVDGASAVSSFVMCSTIPWDMVMPPESTTCVRSSRISSTQLKRSAPTVAVFSSESKEYLRSVRIFIRYSLRSRPDKPKRKMA